MKVGGGEDELFLGIDYLRDEKEAGGTLNTLYLAKRVKDP